MEKKIKNEEKAKSAKKKEFFVITTLQLLFINGLIVRFPYLKIHTRKFKAENYAKLLLKFDFKHIYNNLEFKTEKEKYEYLYKITFAVFLNEKKLSMKDRIIKREKEKGFEEKVKLVETFLDKKYEELKKEDGFKNFVHWEKNTTRDLIKNCYLTAYTRQILAFDTTELCKDCFLTCICDHASGIILKYLITNSEPKACEIIFMIESYFTPKLMERCKIIHCDRCGNNLSTEYIQHFEGKGFQLSHTEKTKHNQLIESTNGALKILIKNYKIEGYPDEITFEDLIPSEREKYIEKCIELFNTTPDTKKESKALCGTPRQTVDNIKELLYFLRDKKHGEAYIIVNSNTSRGKCIYEWHKLIINTYNLLKLQIQLNKEYNLTINIIDKKNLNALDELCKHSDVSFLTPYQIENNRKEKELTEIKNKTDALKNLKLTTKQIEQKLKDYLGEKIANAKTSEEREKVEYTYGLFLLDEERNKENLLANKILSDKVSELDKQLIESNEQNKKLIEIINKTNKYFEKQQKDKEIRLIRRRRLRTLQSREKFAVSLSDYWKVMEICNQERTSFARAKYRILHTILRITGIRISNIKYVNFTELTKLMNRQTFFIRLIKTNRNLVLKFPYVRGMDKYIKAIQEDYNYIKKCIEKKDKRLYTIDVNSANERIRSLSELWGYANRSSLTNHVNKQLKNLGLMLKPNKKLTSHAYRRAIAILCARTRGILEAQYILGHASITSTQAYMESEPDLNRLTLSWRAVRDEEDQRKTKKIKMSLEEENDSVEKIERMIKNEIEWDQEKPDVYSGEIIDEGEEE